MRLVTQMVGTALDSRIWLTQALPLTLQAPACATQLAFDVQERVVWIEHLPGSGVHTGFGQFCTGVQVFSGLGGSSSHPSGS